MIQTIKEPQSKMLEIAANWISPEEERVIEIGCDNGNFCKLLKERHITNYVGVDMDHDRIEEAKKLHSNFKFYCADITTNLHFLKKASMIISFQCFEHIREDLKVLNNIKEKTKIILSVPNGPYKYHVRWFEVEGWEKRFSTFIDFNKIIVVQNPRKEAKRSFLFKGVRNNYIDEETLKNFRHLTFDTLMSNRNL